MDPTSTYLGKMLLEEITPVVMVLRTPLVEESCKKNGLSFVQMLQPFCTFNDIDVPVRTASDQPYRLHRFKLRLHYASDIRQPNVEAAEERLKKVVTRASETDTTDLSSDPPPIETLIKSAAEESHSPRFQVFNKELIGASSFSEHEAFDHPVACLLVVSSKDVQPTNTVVDLFNTNQFPSLINDGAMDPQIVKHYLLIHDNQDGPSDKANNIISEMRGTFGSSACRMLCINSAENGSGDCQDNPWSLYKSDVQPGQGLGCFLNVDDLDEMKDLMQDLASKHIIPHMEQKIRLLNQQVSATRRGFRNQIKNLWWRKGKEDIPDAPTGPMYTFSSIESQIRVLGDYAFMLRDYELALQNYRLLSTDYKLDKAWKRYAGVQEMMGLAYFMLDQSRKDAEYCMENAFTTYLKLGASGQRNATRCGLWWTEMLKARDQYKEAAGVYFRISNEEPSLHAAVMLEQASYCYLLSNPPFLRKYGFHLVLSGNRYYVSDQRKHAIRAYRSALSVYKGNYWKYINDHVHYHIGKWYAVLGVYDIAIKHMLQVLSCGHQSIVTQELFLRDFLHIVQKLGRTFEVFRLQLPLIVTPSLKVIFEDHRTYASSSAVNVKESLWKSLEEDLVPTVSIIRSNWLDSLPRKKLKDSNVCVAGEAIKVEIEFKNPLKIPVSVSGASLICQLSVKTDPVESEAGDRNINEADRCSSTNGYENDLELEKLKSSWELSNSSFVLSEVNFSLGGSEKTAVQLVVTPRIEGTLDIIGMRWKLSESVVGYQNFTPGQAKKQGKRRARRSPSSNLKFTVIKGLPKLDGFIHHLPQRPYAGELRRVVLELKNQSKFSVKNLKMKINHPRFLYPGSFDDIKVDFPSCLEKQRDHEHNNVEAGTSPQSRDLLFSFPEDIIIQGETTFSWPLWLRAPTPGSISLNISIYYEIENASSDMRYRTLRMHYNIEVLPSLDVSVQITRCPSRLQEFLLRVDILNKTSSESFQLHQFSSVDRQWEISSLPPNGIACPSQLVVAGQALSRFFKLKNCGRSTSDVTPSSHNTLVGSDISLSPEGGTDVLFDISNTPLANFHQYERLHQEKSLEGNPSNIDFILIALPQESMDGTSAPARLFCHYACHCSIESTSPLWWRVDGPRALQHDFSSSFCEVELQMTIHNSSDYIASVRINTLDAASLSGQPSGITSSPKSLGNQEGWHDVSLTNDIKVTSDVTGTQSGKSSSVDNTSPFIWSASSSTKVEVGPKSCTKVPLQISLFSPGTFNLSDYNLHWSLRIPASDDGVPTDQLIQSSGTSRGHSYYLTVLQSPSGVL